MSEVPKKLVVDLASGAKQYIELSPAEISERDQNIAAHLEEQARLRADKDAQDALKESAKAKLVAGEPLTAEEAAVLVI